MENWKEIKGYEGRYEVSDYGRVRSVSRIVKTHKGFRRMKSKILSLHTWGAQYPGIVLYDENNVGKRKMAHQLVADAFIPNPFGYSQINHLDANRVNPAASNLEWCDQSKNMRHAYAIGNRPVGEKHHFAKLKRDAHGRCLSASQ